MTCRISLIITCPLLVPGWVGSAKAGAVWMRSSSRVRLLVRGVVIASRFSVGWIHGRALRVCGKGSKSPGVGPLISSFLRVSRVPSVGLFEAAGRSQIWTTELLYISNDRL